MFEYNTTFFPLVIVKFLDTIKTDEELEDFFNLWKKLYEDKKKFIFLFDTTELGFVNVSYCYKLKKKIDEIKKEPEHFLSKSIILVSNVYIKHLLNLIFNITTPVATVYIYNNKGKEIINNKFYIDLLNLIEENKLENFKIIKSNKL